MKHPALHSIFLILVTCLVSCMGFSACYADMNQTGGKLDGFDEFFTRTMAEYDIPGAVVGIVENDTVVYLKGFGLREIGKPGKVDPETRFQIASVSKYVTATAIGTLADEGKLNWDTPVVTYLPDFALKDTYAGNHTTLRDLLAHRTGLRHFDGDLLGRLGYKNQELLERMRFLEPGTSFRRNTYIRTQDFSLPARSRQKRITGAGRI